MWSWDQDPQRAQTRGLLKSWEWPHTGEVWLLDKHRKSVHSKVMLKSPRWSKIMQGPARSYNGAIDTENAVGHRGQHTGHSEI